MYFMAYKHEFAIQHILWLCVFIWDRYCTKYTLRTELYTHDRFPPTVSCSRGDTAGQKFISFIWHQLLPLSAENTRLLTRQPAATLRHPPRLRRYQRHLQNRIQTDESSGLCDATVAFTQAKSAGSSAESSAWTVEADQLRAHGGGRFQRDNRGNQVNTRRSSVNTTLLYCQPIRCD